jgi:nucleotide-binding universal stress UspA family protein
MLRAFIFPGISPVLRNHN